MTSKKSPAQIEKALRQRLLDSFNNNLFVTRHKIIVGFSGGNDSLALALLLKGIERAINADIVLVHVDHRIRPESGEDAKKAQKLAKEIGFPFKLLRAADHPSTLFPGVGLEDAARRERFRLLISMIDEPHDAIALAHHANDQAETMLLHLLRGSGVDGMAGMTEVTKFAIDWGDLEDGEEDEDEDEGDFVFEDIFADDEDFEDDEDAEDDDNEGSLFSDFDSPFGVEFVDYNTIWRPLLRETRKDLEKIVARSGLNPIEDPSNLDLDFRRNAIRHNLIPLIAEIEPDFLDRFGTLAQIAAEESAIVESLASEYADKLIKEDGSLEIYFFRQLGEAIARRVVRQWLVERVGEVPTFERVEAVVALARESLPSGVIEVGGGNVVAGYWSQLYCGRIEAITEMMALRAGLLLPPVGSERGCSIDGDTIQVSGTGTKPVTHSRTFDVPPDAVLSIEPVDRSATPPGMRSPFGNQMRDHGVPPWMRDKVLGVAFDEKVHWVPYNRDSNPKVRTIPRNWRTITVETTIEESNE